MINKLRIHFAIDGYKTMWSRHHSSLNLHHQLQPKFRSITVIIYRIPLVINVFSYNFCIIQMFDIDAKQPYKGNDTPSHRVKNDSYRVIWNILGLRLS